MWVSVLHSVCQNTSLKHFYIKHFNTMMFLPRVTYHIIFSCNIFSFFFSFSETCRSTNTKFLNNQVNNDRIFRRLCKQKREQHV